MDLFEKFNLNDTPLGKYYELAHGYFMYPQLEGEIGPRMKFMGKEMKMCIRDSLFPHRQ